MSAHTPTPTRPGALAPGTTPEEGLLTAALVLAPLVYLAADCLYAVRGWDAPAGGVLHVLGAVLYLLAFLRVASWLPAASWLRAALVLVGAVGTAGNVAYGFEAIHASLGDIALVDQPGAAALIKPLGLFFPLALLLVAVAVGRTGRRTRAVVLAVAGLAWPVAHIADVAPLAVAIDLALLVCLGTLVRGPVRRR